MQATIEDKTEFTWGELSASAKDHAREHWRDGQLDMDWFDEVYEDAANVGLKITGFDLGRGQEIDLKFEDCFQDVAEKILKEHGETCETYQVALTFLATYVLLSEEQKDDIDQWGEISSCDFVGVFSKSIRKAYLDMLQTQYDYLQSDEACDQYLETETFNENGDVL